MIYSAYSETPTKGTTLITLKATNIEPTQLDELIDMLYVRMKELPPESDNFSNTADQYVKLTKLRDESNARTRVSPDALASVFGSLAGILAILSYERMGHVIATKAVGFVMKAVR